MPGPHEAGQCMHVRGKTRDGEDCAVTTDLLPADSRVAPGDHVAAMLTKLPVCRY